MKPSLACLHVLLRRTWLLPVLLLLVGCTPNLHLEERDDAATLARSYTKTIEDRQLLKRNATELDKNKGSINLPVMDQGSQPGTNGLLLEQHLTGHGDTTVSGSGGASNPSATAPPKAETFPVKMEFQDESLLNLVKIIFGEYLKQPYSILADFIDKKVNFSFKGEVTKEEMLQIFETFLELHGVQIKFNEGIYAITLDKGVKSAPFRKRALGEVTAVFKLRHILTSEFSTLARQFLTASERTVELARFNTLVITAPRSQINAMESLAAALDLPFFDGKHILIYLPRFVQVKVLEDLLNHAQDQMAVGGAKGSAKAFEVKAMESRNRLVIVTTGQEATDLIKELLTALDGPSANERKAYQYRMNTQIASEIMTTLTPVIKSIMIASSPLPEVVADKGSNSLVIMATATEFAEIKKLIERLDQPLPSAVHIDVTVAQVALNENMKYGVEWYLKNKLGPNLTGDATLSLKKASPSLSLGVVNLLSNKYLALDLLGSETKFSVISNPQVTVRNGGVANINVGQEIGITKSTTSLEGSTTPTTKAEIQRVDVSIKMEVKPTISANGRITIFLKLEEKRPAGESGGQPAFTTRQLTTELVTHDGETTFLGGLLERTLESNATKVPGFGDLPWIGALFHDADKKDSVVELIVLLTARLVVDAQGARMVTKAVLDAFPERLLFERD